MAVVDSARRSLAVSVPALIAALLAAGDDVLYVILIRSQGSSFEARVAFVATFLAAVAGIAAAAALVPRPEIRILLLAVVTGALLALGILALFSIGLPILAAGVFAAVAWSRTSAEPTLSARARRIAAALAPVGPLVLLAGIALT